MEEEQVIEQKKERMIGWIRNPYNLGLVLILLFTIALRLYYFVITKNQPLWYDEADYMSTANNWRGVGFWEYNPIRAILFPLIATIIMKLGLGEIGVRFFILLASILSVLLIYKIGELLFNKKVGLVSAAALSFFWSYNFYSYRVLIDVPLTTFWLGTIFLFFKSYLQDRNYNFFIATGIILGLSFLLKFASVVLVLLLGIYLITTEGLNIIKNKKIITMYLASLLVIIPYFIWQKIVFGSFFKFYTAAIGGDPNPRPFINSLVDQTIFSFKILDTVLMAFIIIGIIWLIFELILANKSIFKKNSRYNKNYFILLWTIFGLLFFGWFNYGTYMDERYYFVFYPAYFLIAAVILIKISDYLKSHYKYAAIIFILAVLLFSGYQNIIKSDQTINLKKDSFIQLKYAGDFIRENSLKTDSILIMDEYPEVIYYSERNYSLLNSKYENISSFKNALDASNSKFIVVSSYQLQNNPHRIAYMDYLISHPSKFIVVQYYEPIIQVPFGAAIAGQKVIPLTIIFAVNKTD